MKKIIGTSEYDFDSLQHEYDILRQLSNSKKLNVVKIYGVQNKKLDRTTSVVYILMELAECDWDKEINMRSKNNQFYKENEIKNIMKSLISSFCDLQKEKITHRDIKPQNILKIKDNLYKIADFGEAKELMKNKSNTDMQTIRGTELFMSPILFNAVRKQRLNNNTIIHNIYKSDVFSLGFCFLYAMTLDIKCLYDIREETDQNKMEKEIRRFIGKKYGENIVNIIIIMLKLEENERLDFIDLNNLIHKSGF
jgi:serine/threonine protein kinase